MKKKLVFFIVLISISFSVFSQGDSISTPSIRDDFKMYYSLPTYNTMEDARFFVLEKTDGVARPVRLTIVDERIGGTIIFEETSPSGIYHKIVFPPKIGAIVRENNYQTSYSQRSQGEKRIEIKFILKDRNVAEDRE